jgi:branched-chain amino acid transport system substrate-binding protein
MDRRVLGALGALAITLAACGGQGTTGASSAPSGSGAAKKPDVKVGLVVSLTGVGNVYGPVQKNGAELAVQRINDAGGVNGAKLQLVVDDDQSTTDGGVTAFRKQVSQDRVVAILGPTLSNTAVAAHPVAQSAQTPVIAISNTGDGIVGKCSYGPCDYIFRASLGESTAIPATVGQIKKMGIKNVVVVYAQDDKFSSDGFAIFKKNLESQSLTIKKEIAFSKNDVDLSGVVTQALAENPDAIVDSSLAGPAINILKEVAKRKPGLPVVGGNGFNTPAIIASAGAAAEGAISGTAWYLGNPDPVNKEFVAAYKAKYNADPDQFAAQAYSAMYILLDALKRTPNVTSVLHDKLRDQIELTTGVKTPLGEFSFNSSHDVNQKVYVVQVKNGQFTQIN